jgi:glycosyltransferase involved in cell wall biosynthesis
VPLIATDAGGIPEILNPAIEQLLPAGDTGALAGRMLAALDAPDRMRAEAMVRRDRVKQGFSLASMASRIEDIYRDALEGYREHPASPALKADFPR